MLAWYIKKKKLFKSNIILFNHFHYYMALHFIFACKISPNKYIFIKPSLFSGCVPVYIRYFYTKKHYFFVKDLWFVCVNLTYHPIILTCLSINHVLLLSITSQKVSDIIWDFRAARNKSRQVLTFFSIVHLLLFQIRQFICPLMINITSHFFN